MLGSRIGNYTIESQIGEGGMGIVYQARHALLGRTAAVKVLRAAAAEKRDAVTRFFNEARAATAIKHPGIVEIYDFGFADDGSAYIIMEHLSGESLARRMRRNRALSPEVWLPLMRQIAGALQAAHDARIVHRDLKPDNIFLIRDPEIAGGERIKLLDFGIAKLAPQVDDHGMTQTGTILGTPTYMAPEQCRGARAVDHRADLYALGCIMYELACGRPPFVTDGVGELIAKHIYFQAAPPRQLNPALPVRLERVILALLAKEPDARPQQASDLIALLDEELTDTLATPMPGSVAIPPPLDVPSLDVGPQFTTLSGSVVEVPAARLTNTRRRWLIAGAAAMAIGIGVAVMVKSSDRAPSPAAAQPPATAAPSVAAPAPAATPTPAPAAETETEAETAAETETETETATETAAETETATETAAETETETETATETAAETETATVTKTAATRPPRRTSTSRRKPPPPRAAAKSTAKTPAVKPTVRKPDTSVGNQGIQPFN